MLLLSVIKVQLPVRFSLKVARDVKKESTTVNASFKQVSEQ